MKAKQLVGVVTIGILITATVVVAFVQQAATTLNRRVHSSSQIASSSDDLTTLLGTTKYDIETGKQFAKTTGSKITNTAITTPIPTSETSKAVVKPLSSLKTSLLEVSPPEDDKTLPLGNFIKEKLTGQNIGSASPDSSWDTAAANVDLLRDNLFGFIGKESKVPESIAHYFKDLPEEAKPWLAVATGATLAIIGSSINKKTPSKKVPVDSIESIQATSDAIGSLTDELGSLQSRMKSLEANGLKLDSKLKDATSKLTLKELDISKARLKAADISLNLGREIELLKQKLDENDAKVLSLDADLAQARAECELLVKELNKAKDKKLKEVSSEAIKEEKKVNDGATVKKTKKVSSERTAPKKSKPKNEEKLPLLYADETELSTEEKIDGKNTVKNAVKKKTPSPKKEVTKVRSERTAPKKSKPKNEGKLPLSYTDEAELSTEEKVDGKNTVKNAAKKKTPSLKKEATKVRFERTAPKKSKPKNEEKLSSSYTDEAELFTEEKVEGKNLVNNAAKKKTPSPKKEATKVRSERTAPKNEEKLPLSYTDEAELSTEEKVQEKNPVKSAAMKKTLSPKKEAAIAQIKELPTAEAPVKKRPLKKKPRVQKKGVTEVKITSKDFQKASATKDTTPEKIKIESESSKVSPKGTPEKSDLTALSKSALSRKTVKELREFLESKGLSITEDDGKPLKKNGLLEAVRSL